MSRISLTLTSFEAGALLQLLQENNNQGADERVPTLLDVVQEALREQISYVEDE